MSPGIGAVRLLAPDDRNLASAPAGTLGSSRANRPMMKRCRQASATALQ